MPTEKPARSKMEEVLDTLRLASLDLAKDNDPNVDATLQNAARTQALAAVVAKLAECVMGGLGSTGIVVAKLNERVGGLGEEITLVREAVAANMQPTAEETAPEEIEVDNTGAPEEETPAPAPAAAPQLQAPSQARPRRPRPQAAAPSAGSVPLAQTSSPPAPSMPPEIAALAAAGK